MEGGSVAENLAALHVQSWCRRKISKRKSKRKTQQSGDALPAIEDENLKNEEEGSEAEIVSREEEEEEEEKKQEEEKEES